MTDRDPDCLFCKIVAGEIPSDRVYEDDDVIAFRDINPRAPTHLLIIPRRHVADVQHLTDADGELLARLFGAVRTLAARRSSRAATGSSRTSDPTPARRCPTSICHLLGGRSMSWPPG